MQLRQTWPRCVEVFQSHATAPRVIMLPLLTCQVADSYQRLAGMVDEQGKDLDKIETNVIDAEASTQAGVGHLNKAASYQKKYGRCLLILVVILLVVALAVGGYFGYEAVRAP